MTPKIFINKNDEPLNSQDLPSRNPDVQTFHQSLPHYQKTPLVSLSEIAKELGLGHVLLKDESKRFGLNAFKILGASWATKRSLEQRLGLSNSSLQQLATAAQTANLTLYAATDGNHGRAVARMSSYLNISSRIFVPNFLESSAQNRITAEGASLTVFDGNYDKTVIATKAAAEKHEEGKGVLISDTALDERDETARWIVEGYQTMFDEIEEQVFEVTGERRVDAVVTPVGVGSLAQATVTHFQRSEARKMKPVIATVEPVTAACLKSSLEAGSPVTVDARYTICTGMCCGTISLIGWQFLSKGVGIAVATRDEEVDEAVIDLRKYGVFAGPCGAASLAGLRGLVSAGRGEVGLGPDSVVVILCTEGEREYKTPSSDS